VCKGFKYWIGTLAAVFLGMILVSAGVGKLMAGAAGFVSLGSLAFLPQSFVGLVGFWLPYVEIAVGSLLVLGIAVRFAASLSVLLLLSFMTSNMLLIYLGAGFEPCSGCFGIVGEFTAISALVLDMVMVGMVIAVFTCYRGGLFDMPPAVLRR